MIRLKTGYFAFFMMIGLLAPALAVEIKPLQVSVNNGAVLRELPIVRFDLPAEWRERTFDVVELRSPPAACAVQREGGAVYWRANKPIQAGESVRFELRENPHVESRSVISAKVDEQGVTLSAGEDRIAQYNTRVVEPPKGKSPLYRKSGHLHPLWTPSGKVVTEEFPLDHIHQHGMFSAWVNTEFDGRKTDFWNQGGGTGTVLHKALKESNSGPVFGEVTAVLEHQALTDGTSPVVALHETMRLRAYASPRPMFNVFDVDLEQRAASLAPLKVLKYHYGGFAVRGAKEWFKQPESGMLTSEGKTQKSGNETRPKWVDMSGVVDGQPCGIAVIPHPDSFRGPQPVRLHPDKPYFVFSPPILGEFEITQDQPYRAQYRIVLHDGAGDAKLLDQLAAEYAEPLVATSR